jgi:gliding motility-associated protein GldM
MAIPKNPRQLMINIMYLVLTALLALNVSAEIFNAFKVVDEGLKQANTSLDQSNEQLGPIIIDRAKADKEKEQYAERVEPAQTYSEELTDFIDDLIDQMIEASGGYREKDGKKELVGQKNKDVTTRLLVYEGRGAELKNMIQETSEKFLTLIDSGDVANFAANIPLKLDDQSWREVKGKASWEDFNFRQMPLAAVLPILNKIKNDAKNTEAAVLNYLVKIVGGEDIVLDQFQVVSSAKKTYVIAGETFETDIFLSASAGTSNVGIEVAVNGQNLPVDNGVATYSATTSRTGVIPYKATITVTNPVTGEVKEYESNFEYEVGLRSVNVSADKMNVFYIGVDNPVSVSAAGVSSNQLNVSGSGGGISLNPVGGGKYNVKVTQPGDATITVSGGGLQPTKFAFRVKRIPDPVAKLTNKQKGGSIPNGVFKAQGGVLAELENFDFDARCDIQGFTLVRVPRREDPMIAVNGGARFTSEAVSIVNQARPGDRFFFENVKARCPGDSAGRTINDMVFNIN